MRPAYPAPHRGSHEGVPLRCCLAPLVEGPPLPFGHFPRERGKAERAVVCRRQWCAVAIGVCRVVAGEFGGVVCLEVFARK